MRFEMEMERMKQIHQKELEDKEEELEDVHKSSQRRVGLTQFMTTSDHHMFYNWRPNNS